MRSALPFAARRRVLAAVLGSVPTVALAVGCGGAKPVPPGPAGPVVLSVRNEGPDEPRSSGLEIR